MVCCLKMWLWPCSFVRGRFKTTNRNMKVVCRKRKLQQIVKRFGSSGQNRVRDDALWLVSVYSSSFIKLNIPDQVFDYTKADLPAILTELAATDWNSLFSNQSTDRCWDIFKGVLQDVEYKYVPLKSVNPSKGKPVWMSHVALKAVKYRHRKFRKYKDPGHPQGQIQEFSKEGAGPFPSITFPPLSFYPLPSPRFPSLPVPFLPLPSFPLPSALLPLRSRAPLNQPQGSGGAL